MDSFRVLFNCGQLLQKKNGTWYRPWISAHFKCNIVLNVHLSTFNLSKKLRRKKSLWSIKISERKKEKGKEEGEGEVEGEEEEEWTYFKHRLKLGFDSRWHFPSSLWCAKSFRTFWETAFILIKSQFLQCFVVCLCLQHIESKIHFVNEQELREMKNKREPLHVQNKGKVKKHA